MSGFQDIRPIERQRIVTVRKYPSGWKSAVMRWIPEPAPGDWMESDSGSIHYENKEHAMSEAKALADGSGLDFFEELPR